MRRKTITQLQDSAQLAQQMSQLSFSFQNIQIIKESYPELIADFMVAVNRLMTINMILDVNDTPEATVNAIRLALVTETADE